MSVRKHRITAVSILVVGLALVMILGQTLAGDPAEVQALRSKMQGAWVASLVEVSENIRLEGKAAEACRVEFDGDKVFFHQLVGGIDARGTYFFDRPKSANKVDFKLNAGWMIGIYEIDGATLKLCLNALALPEQLGVPSRPEARKFESGNGRILYVFHRLEAAH